MNAFQDDRTDAQRLTHRWGVRMYDAFMSRWGGASGGASVAVWACATLREAEIVESWVKSRSEARRVAVVDLTKHRHARGVAHVHVYVVEPGHPGLRGCA